MGASPGHRRCADWTEFTAAYSGLEQTLKSLVTVENGLTILELINSRFRNTPMRMNATQEVSIPDTQLRAGDYSQGSRNRRRRYGIYGRFRSLHSYIAIRRADQSHHPIAGRQGVGFERRIYTRIEDKPLLRNSPEALAAVWGVCVQVAEELALSRFPEHIDSERDHALWP